MLQIVVAFLVVDDPGRGRKEPAEVHERRHELVADRQKFLGTGFGETEGAKSVLIVDQRELVDGEKSPELALFGLR